MLLEAFLNGVLIGALAVGIIGYKFTVRPMRELLKRINAEDRKNER